MFQACQNGIFHIIQIRLLVDTITSSLEKSPFLGWGSLSQLVYLTPHQNVGATAINVLANYYEVP